MKPLALALTGLILLGGAAPIVRADDDARCPMCGAAMDQNPGDKADHLATMLDLSDKQKADVQKLIEAKHAKMKPAMEQMQKTMKAADDDFDAGMKKILDQKQQKKWEEMRKMHHGGMMGHGMHHGMHHGEGPGDSTK